MHNFLFSPSSRKVLQSALLLALLLFSFGPRSALTVYAAPPTNDDFGSATVVPAIPYTNTVSTTEATPDVTGDPPTNDPAVPGSVRCDGKILSKGVKTVWYRYSSPTTRIVNADSFNSTYDNYIAVWRGTTINNLTFIACDDETEFDEAQVAFTAQAGQTYYIQVAAYNGSIDPNFPNQGNPGGTLQFHVTNFADVPGDFWAWRYVEGLYAAGVTAGCSASPTSLYCPVGGVTRDQMAVFLLKAIHGSSYVPPAATGDFQDVPVGYWAAAWIEQLAVEGITVGCTVNPNNYCPLTPVARDQMAVFLLKAKYGAGYTPPAQSGVFLDVPVGYWAGTWIEQLAAEGITGGCGAGNYCPTATVSRDQMAVFVVKTFNLTLLP
jgi:hypothetical protein